jgi:AcrR family transcriptional regulator
MRRSEVNLTQCSNLVNYFLLNIKKNRYNINYKKSDKLAEATGMTKGEKTKLRIIETAVDCFYEVGLTETSFKMISERSGLTQPGIYAYFHDKNSLLLACSAYAIEQGRQYVGGEVSREKSAKDVLKTYLSMNLKWVFTDRKVIHSLIAMYYFGATHPPLQELHWSIDQNAISRIEGYLLAGNREGAWKIRDPKKIAREIHSLLVGEMIKIFHWPGERGHEERHRDLWSFILKAVTP